MQKLLDPVTGLLQTVITVKSVYSSVWELMSLEAFTARGRLLVENKWPEARQDVGEW